MSEYRPNQQFGWSSSQPPGMGQGYPPPMANASGYPVPPLAPEPKRNNALILTLIAIGTAILITVPFLIVYVLDPQEADTTAVTPVGPTGWTTEDVSEFACHEAPTVAYETSNENWPGHTGTWHCGILGDNMLSQFQLHRFGAPEDIDVLIDQTDYFILEFYDTYFIEYLSDGSAVLGGYRSMSEGYRTLSTLAESEERIEEIAREFDVEPYYVPHEPDF